MNQKSLGAVASPVSAGNLQRSPDSLAGFGTAKREGKRWAEKWETEGGEKECHLILHSPPAIK